MNLTIELKPHVGKKNDPIVGEVDITHDQWVIYVKSEQLKIAGRNKLQVGYVGMLPGRPINFLPAVNRFGPGVSAEIAKSVRKALAEIASNAVEAADDTDAKKRAEANLAAEREKTRRDFSPPSDALMSAPPPSSDELSLNDVDSDDAETLP